ncbi:hypothetical protein AMECASPLE_014933 [Ameca splendens]|uniref:Uncharacterized protein n=1 Tax=Ameca splendens TaxID=208324 RepID=A0ABV0YCU2_9TELE
MMDPAPALTTEGLADASAPAHATEGLSDASAPALATEGPGDASAAAPWTSLQSCLGRRRRRCAILQGCLCRSRLIMDPGRQFHVQGQVLFVAVHLLLPFIRQQSRRLPHGAGNAGAEHLPVVRPARRQVPCPLT